MFPQRLTLARLTHDALYVVMACAALAVLYAGLTGARGPWLGVALALIVTEVVVFVGFGMKCPAGHPGGTLRRRDRPRVRGGPLASDVPRGLSSPCTPSVRSGSPCLRPAGPGSSDRDGHSET
jgi:hypothetical protein